MTRKDSMQINGYISEYIDDIKTLYEKYSMSLKCTECLSFVK